MGDVIQFKSRQEISGETLKKTAYEEMRSVLTEISDRAGLDTTHIEQQAKLVGEMAFRMRNLPAFNRTIELNEDGVRSAIRDALIHAGDHAMFEFLMAAPRLCMPAAFKN